MELPVPHVADTMLIRSINGPFDVENHFVWILD